MAFSAQVLQLLISAPGDIPKDELETIRRTISQWNLNFGRAVGITVLPVSWTEHAASEFGDRPQAILNSQIVEDADLAVALFRDRLGTPTGEAESGTAEEIQLLVQSGKSVAVLTSAGDRAPLKDAELEERQRLVRYLNELRETALVLEYSDPGELAAHMNNFLSRVTARFQQSSESVKEMDQEIVDPSEGVWPRIEVKEYTTNDSKGRITHQRKWSLVLHNASKGPARDVDFRFEGLPDGAFFDFHRPKGSLGTIPPDREMKFPLFIAMGSPEAAECIVSWTDTSGATRLTTATVRI